jgi:DNA helicase HerA-like ATPase
MGETIDREPFVRNGRLSPDAEPDPEAGKVLGTLDAMPLDFWVGVDESRYLELDDVIAVTTDLPEPAPDGTHEVTHYGVVDEVKSGYEGATFHSDVFRVERGQLPVGLSTVAHVSVTRVEPELFVPPRPGRPVRRAASTDREFALYFDRMQHRFAAGLSRNGLPIFGNLDFLDGTRGAHVNISGVSGVATKTTYALFLLYSLFNGNALPLSLPAHAIVFNVKGQDLLWLDKPNARLPDTGDAAKYGDLGLPVTPFASVALWAPPQPGDVAIPDTGARTTGVAAYFWTLREFCADRLLRFVFAEADDETSQLSYAVRQVEAYLQANLSPSSNNASIQIDDTRIDSFDTLVKFISDNIQGMTPRLTPQTQEAFLRRLEDAAPVIGNLVRSSANTEAASHRLDWTQKQVNVIDINRLNDRAKRFVVGVVVKRLMDDKDKSGTRWPLVFLVLDELNKYAPREGHSPIKEVILDIAERGRSLGVVLIGAQQTASEIERRVTANASFRVVGRLDAAERQRDEYGFLTDTARKRSTILKPGTMFVHQPDVPVPLLVQFPFPAWATRQDEVDMLADQEPTFFRRSVVIA